MGNLIAAISSVPVALVSELIIVPHIWSPTRWGDIPWTPPPFWIGELVSIILMIGISVVSGVMSSLQKCKRKNIMVSLRNSKWHVFGYIIGRIFALLAFPLKTIMLAGMTWVPFAKKVSEGLITAVFILFTGSIGNTLTRQTVC